MPDKEFDISIPIPDIARADRYTAETPEAPDTVVLSIPIPVVTLASTSVSEEGYLTGEQETVPVPEIAEPETDIKEITPVSKGYEHYIMTPPEVEIATRYMAETPIAAPLEHQIMIPEIALDARLFIYTAVDNYLVFESPDTYTDQTSEANDVVENDVDLFPESPGIWDGFMVGMKHPYWDRIRIDIGTAGVGTWQIEWLYWNGVAWVGIGGVEDGTNSLQVSGRNDVIFEQPTLWSLKTVNGAERYWVYCRIVTLDALTIRPLGTRLWVGVISSYLKNTRQTMNEQPGIAYMTHLDNTPIELPRGKEFIWQFKLVDYRDGMSQRSLLNPAVYYAKDGAAWALLGAAFAEIDFGWYSVAIDAAIADAGRLVMRVHAPGAAQCDLVIEFY